MLPFIPQQASSIANANLQIMANVTQRYAHGIQQLAELNLQTVKTLWEESTTVAKAGTAARPSDFLGWESTLFAELPEKAAAYSRHFFSIVRATEADIFNEAFSQYEKYGINVKGAFESALQQGQFAAQGVSALVADVTDRSTQVANEIASKVADANTDVVRTTVDASSTAAADLQETDEQTARALKAGAKR
ncbi:phasin family protein [Caballeronia arvi]|uniref:Phasin family protein n=1 Tax=Caballeronia arvi TaxID=1777135 RepID=A0A158L2N6_9BURK|nr:TIGR01841 family phasin [Caballeronia arvi]SAL87644.1 phasin family protein [Caballeronia arvi]